MAADLPLHRTRKYYQEREEFLRIHANADEVICRLDTNEPFAALYRFPKAVIQREHRQKVRDFFAELRRRTQDEANDP